MSAFEVAPADRIEAILAETRRKEENGRQGAITMRHETPTWLGGIGALLVAIVCTVATGLPGFLAGMVFFLLWYTVPTLYTVAFGQLVVAALADGMAVEYLLALELGLLAVLVGPSLTLDRPDWRVAVTSGRRRPVRRGTLASLRWGG